MSDERSAWIDRADDELIDDHDALEESRATVAAARAEIVSMKRELAATQARLAAWTEWADALVGESTREAVASLMQERERVAARAVEEMARTQAQLVEARGLLTEEAARPCRRAGAWTCEDRPTETVCFRCRVVRALASPTTGPIDPRTRPESECVEHGASGCPFPDCAPPSEPCGTCGGSDSPPDVAGPTYKAPWPCVCGRRRCCPRSCPACTPSLTGTSK